MILPGSTTAPALVTPQALHYLQLGWHSRLIGANLAEVLPRLGARLGLSDPLLQVRRGRGFPSLVMRVEQRVERLCCWCC